MNIHITRQTVIGSVVALASLGLVASSAQAAPRPRDLVCKGVVKETTVRNVTVPAGASCSLSHAAVTGRVTVGANARFTMAHIRIDRGLRLAEGTTFKATGGDIRQGITGVAMAGATLNGTVVSGPVKMKIGYVVGGSTEASLTKVSIDGPVTLSAQTVSLTDVKANGTLRAEGMGILLTRASVVGDLKILAISHTRICGSVVNSDSAISGNKSATLGGPRQDCAGNRFTGDVVLEAQAVSVNRNIFRGDLGGRAAYVNGSGNRFYGDVTGDMAQLQD